MKPPVKLIPIVILVFISTMFGCKLRHVQQNSENPNSVKSHSEISFETKVLNSDTIKEGDIYTFKYKFTNTGNLPLKIESVTTSCGCIKADWNSDPVAPGKSGKITAIFNSLSKRGAYSKSLYVVTNASAERQILSCEGYVKYIK